MDFEKRRFEIQIELDQKKTGKERNRLGQFSTPFNLASDIMKYVRKLIGTSTVSFLEPAIGTGVFYSAFRANFDKNCHAVGYEIDSYYSKPASDLWSGTNLEIRQEDFLSASANNEKFSLIVTNPPYSRHHHIDSSRKKELQKQVKSYTGFDISGLTGLYGYFLILSTRWLQPKGFSCWLIPSEFMDVNYGKTIKEFLLEKVELISIHRFEPDDLQFTDALVTSSVVIFQNIPPTGKDVLFSSGGSILSPKNVRYINRQKLSQTEKWSLLFTEDSTENNSYAVIGDYFSVKRGIATGNNNFFIIPDSIVEKYEIPARFLTPVLPAPRNLATDEIDSIDGIPQLEKRLFLFNCNLQEDEIKDRFPKLWNYIENGIKNGANESYNCRNRTPWYSCETREPSPLLVTYMGRSESKNRIFRFILNRTKAVATNSYLLLYPKEEFKYKLRDSYVLKTVWEILNSIPKEDLKKCGRVYGGGLYKLEPKELLKAPASKLEYVLGRKQSLFG